MKRPCSFFAIVPGLIFTSLVSQMSAQSALPEFGPVYSQSEVPIIRVYLPADSLEQMIDEENNSHIYEAQLIFESTEISDTVPNAGIRLRGNTSLEAVKKSFRISFNAFDDGGDWQEIEQMNLIAQHNDPSLVRSKLCHDMFRYMGVASARTSFVALYINDEYRGLYLNQEHMDEEFAKKYFDEEGDGNLYKCTYPATLEYLGSDPNLYKFANWGTRHYELKTNEWQDNYSDLAHLIDVLNNTSLEELPCALPLVLDVDAWLRAAAVEVVCGHWDGYIYNKNNFYLYHNQLTGLFQYIPYDLDNTLGIDWVGQDWTDRNIYNWAPSQEERPLFKRLLEVEEYRDRFSHYVQLLIEDYFDSAVVAQANQWQQLIGSFVEDDVYYTADYGYEEQDFLNALDEAWGEHVEYGIADYVDLRSESALDDLEDYTSPGVIVHWLRPAALIDDSSDDVVIEALVTGPGNENAQLHISVDNVNFSSVTDFNDEGVNGDEVAGDNIFTWTSPVAWTGDKLYYKIVSGTEQFPCDATMMWLTPSTTGFYINEVMSSNSLTVADPAGDYDDWAELWNGTPSSMSLSQKFLTDDLANWNKFALPALTIATGGFVMTWLDNEPEEGNRHVTFRIGADENDLWLIALEEGEPRVMDHFTPCLAGTDLSQERITDGNSVIGITNQATPGSSNNVVGMEEELKERIYAYPNPAQDHIRFSQGISKARIYDMTGRTVAVGVNCTSMSVEHLDAGVYVLQLDGFNTSWIIE